MGGRKRGGVLEGAVLSEEAERQRSELLELQQLWLGLSTSQRAAAVIVIREVRALGPRACRILSMQAERLAMGATQYGDFESGRDWKKETLLEHIDGLAYLAAALLENETETK